MKTTLFIFIAFIMLLLLSCKKEATIKLPPPENKLVVVCFISPDDTMITATVKESAPQYGPQQTGNDVTGATVVLNDDAHSIALSFNPILDAYTASATDFAIVPGKTYYLTVSTPDGKKVNAGTTVPVGQMSLQSVNTNVKNHQKFNEGPGGPSYESFDYDLSLVVNDLPNQTNYLEAHFQQLTIDGGQDTSRYAQPDTLYYDVDLFFDTDESTSKNVYSYKYTSSFYGDSIVVAQVNIGILNCSPEFYHYNESVKRANDADGNPFSEPVFIYTNITNGFGCFGAYVGNYQHKRLQ